MCVAKEHLIGFQTKALVDHWSLLLFSVSLIWVQVYSAILSSFFPIYFAKFP